MLLCNKHEERGTCTVFASFSKRKPKKDKPEANENVFPWQVGRERKKEGDGSETCLHISSSQKDT